MEPRKYRGWKPPNTLTGNRTINPIQLIIEKFPFLYNCYVYLRDKRSPENGDNECHILVGSGASS